VVFRKVDVASAMRPTISAENPSSSTGLGLVHPASFLKKQALRCLLVDVVLDRAEKVSKKTMSFRKLLEFMTRQKSKRDIACL